MCGRYSISASASKLADRFKIDVPEAYRSRFNASPTQILPVITSENPQGLSFFYWGIVPKWAKNKAISPKLYNIKADSLPEKTSSQKALQSRRCLVPADGFFDWKNVSKKRMVPYRFIVKQPSIFAFAGLWEEYEDEEEGMVYTFSIITTRSNSITAEMNHYMPAILSQEDEKKWLDDKIKPEGWISLLKPYPSDLMSSFTISTLLNNPEIDRPEILNPAPAADQFGNYTLFS